MCAKAGLRLSSQYLPADCVVTATMVMATRITQYWNTEAQITYTHELASRAIHHADPTYIEPGQPAPWIPPSSAVSTAPLPILKPTQRPQPCLRLNASEIVLLAVQVRRDVMAHEGEEGGDTESFVAVSDDLQGDGVMVEEYAEPCDEGVNGDHEEDTDDAAE